MPFLLTVSFAQRVTCASKKQFPRYRLSLRNAYLSTRFYGLIRERSVGLKGRNFHPVPYFQLTDHTDFLGVCHVQPATLHLPRRYQEQSEGSFIEGGSHTMSKRLPLDTLFVSLTGLDNSLIRYP